MELRNQRDRLNINIPVLDAVNGVSLGHVNDVSMGGISISGAGALPDTDAHEFEFELVLPWPVNGFKRVTVSVEQRWQGYARSGRWQAGYRVVDCGIEQLVALEQLAGRFHNL